MFFHIVCIARKQNYHLGRWRQSIAYHGVARVIRTHAKNKYSTETKEILARSIKHLPDSTATKMLMKEIPDTTAEGNGMQVWLLHWLEIGEEIRRVNAELSS